MKYRTALSALAIANFASPALANIITGNELYESCGNDRAFVTAYVAGVFDKQEVDLLNALSMRMAASKLSGAENDWFMKGFRQITYGSCVPEGTNLKQLGDVVCRWLEANPEKRHESAATLVGTASGEAWECSGAN